MKQCWLSRSVSETLKHNIMEVFVYCSQPHRAVAETVVGILFVFCVDVGRLGGSEGEGRVKGRKGEHEGCERL